MCKSKIAANVLAIIRSSQKCCAKKVLQYAKRERQGVARQRGGSLPQTELEYLWTFKTNAAQNLFAS